MRQFKTHFYVFSRYVKTVEHCLLALVLIAVSYVHTGIFPFYDKHMRQLEGGETSSQPQSHLLCILNVPVAQALMN